MSFVAYARKMTATQSVTPGWRSVGMCRDGDVFDLEGLNPWQHEWISQSHRIVVANPSYPLQRHDVGVWVIRAPDRVVRFAAGEMSNLAWAFFLPVYSKTPTAPRGFSVRSSPAPQAAQRRRSRTRCPASWIERHARRSSEPSSCCAPTSVRGALPSSRTRGRGRVRRRYASTRTRGARTSCSA